MKKNHIAYEGSRLIIEWYFDESGHSQAFEYFMSLSASKKRKILFLFETIGELGKLFNKEKFRYEGDQIYAFKAIPDRMLCFFYQDAKIIITNGFVKKTKMG